MRVSYHQTLLQSFKYLPKFVFMPKIAVGGLPLFIFEILIEQLDFLLFKNHLIGFDN